MDPANLPFICCQSPPAFFRLVSSICYLTGKAPILNAVKRRGRGARDEATRSEHSLNPSRKVSASWFIVCVTIFRVRGRVESALHAIRDILVTQSLW
jgi:hypothetical protein